MAGARGRNQSNFLSDKMAKKRRLRVPGKKKTSRRPNASKMRVRGKIGPKARMPRKRWPRSEVLARRETFESAPLQNEDLADLRMEQKLELPKIPAAAAKKKEIAPLAATVILGAALLTAIIGGGLVLVLGMDAVLSAGLLLSLFVGFSIVIYELAEARAGRRK